MPCPVFHPTREVNERIYTGGRLPLIQPYAGVCTAHGGSYTPDEDTLFRCCNHGYSPGACSQPPLGERVSSMRYSVLGRTPSTLKLVCVEEVDYEPKSWHRFEYLLDKAEVTGDVPTECIRAQAVAFCQAYVRHFPA